MAENKGQQAGGFDYYYGQEGDQFSFFRIPRVLIKEYTGWQMKRKENAKPSVIKKLREKVAIAARLPRKEKTKEKTREGVR